MPPRQREIIREVERNLLHDMYRRNGALWDVIVNDVRRYERFRQLPYNVQVLYENVERRKAIRRRVRVRKTTISSINNFSPIVRVINIVLLCLYYDCMAKIKLQLMFYVLNLYRWFYMVLIERANDMRHAPHASIKYV